MDQINIFLAHIHTFIMNLKNNHKKLASVHIAFTLLVLFVYFFTKNPNQNDLGVVITVFIIAFINLITTIGCWLKVDFFRQTSQFLLITFLFLPPLVFFLIWWLPWSQWDNSDERKEKVLFNALVFFPSFIAFTFLSVETFTRMG